MDAATFLCQLSDLSTNQVTMGSQFDSVVTHDARTRGPFKIVRWAQQEDGAMIELGLQVI